MGCGTKWVTNEKIDFPETNLDFLDKK